MRIPRNDCNSFFDLGGGVFVNACSFLGSGLTKKHKAYFSKKENIHAPKEAFIPVQLQVSLAAYS